MAILLFGAAKFLPDILPKSWQLGWAQVGLAAAAVLLLGWAVFRIWKQAVPSVLAPAEPRPAAIKGPMPFTPEDAPLFRRLCREDELAKLLGHTLDDQVSLVVMMGESGAGKTSLLRAGLSPVLAIKGVRCIYWEALPSDPETRLLHAIARSWDTAKDGPVPLKLEHILAVLSSSRVETVIVLDQFEQLHPDNPDHQGIFEMLRRIATKELPPHRVRWIVAFRREYDPVWRDFELTLPGFHPPMLSLRLFSEEQAGVIMPTLSEAAGFTLDAKLVTDVARAAANPDGRVSAVEIGIGLLVLSGLAIRKSKTHLTIDDYRFAGGAEGLLTAYIGDRLERFSAGEREGIMKALLALADLDADQRVAEGKTLDELSTASRFPLERLRPCLEYLASLHVRLLEKPSGDRARYRLPHDRVVPSLRQLTGVILAEADQARLAFESAFRSWLNKKNPKFLLSGAELRAILQHRHQIYPGGLPDEKAEFLQQSIWKRLRRRAATLAVTLVVAALSIFFAQKYQELQSRRDLDQWGIPPDLYSYQHQLTGLTVFAPVSNLGWLRANELETLHVHSHALRAVDDLPRVLTELDLSRCSVLKSIAGLGRLPALKTLNLSSTRLSDLADLGELTVLTTLDLSNNPLGSLAGLEKLRALTTLNLSNNRRLSSLDELGELPVLETLNLSGNPWLFVRRKEATPPTEAGSIRNAPGNLAGLDELPALKTLNLSSNYLNSLAGLEKLPALETLDLTKNDLSDLVGIEKLTALKVLNSSSNRLRSLAGLENLTGLTSLDLSKNSLLSPSEFKRSVALTGSDSNENPHSLAALENLTALTELSLSSIGLRRLDGLEQLTALTKLDLSYNSSLSDLVALEKLTGLTELNLSYTRLRSLAGLEKLTALTKLDLSYNSSLSDLVALEKLTALRTLNVSYTRLGRLMVLEKLTALTDLDLSGNLLGNLAGLESLTALESVDLKSHNELSNLAGLEKLTALKTLNLSHNRLGSLDGLESLTQLESLDLSYSSTPITNLKPLARLEKLTTVDLRGTEIESLDGLPPSVRKLLLGD